MVIKIGYKLWDDQNKKVIRSRGVIFNEFVVMYNDRNTSQSESLVQPELVYFESNDILESGVGDKTCQNPQEEEATTQGADLLKEPVLVRRSSRPHVPKKNI